MPLPPPGGGGGPGMCWWDPCVVVGGRIPLCRAPLHPVGCDDPRCNVGPCSSGCWWDPCTKNGVRTPGCRAPMHPVSCMDPRCNVGRCRRGGRAPGRGAGGRVGRSPVVPPAPGRWRGWGGRLGG